MRDEPVAKRTKRIHVRSASGGNVKRVQVVESGSREDICHAIAGALDFSTPELSLMEEAEAEEEETHVMIHFDNLNETVKYVARPKIVTEPARASRPSAFCHVFLLSFRFKLPAYPHYLAHLVPLSSSR